MFEDSKGGNQKNRQYNGQKKKKPQNHATRTPIKSGVHLGAQEGLEVPAPVVIPRVTII